MLIAAGLILLALGLLSGALLLLVPLGIVAGAVGPTLWVLFPLFTIGGYLMAAAAGANTRLPLLSSAAGGLLLLLALIAGVALVLQGGALLEARGDTFSLWYVLGLGLVLGATGLAAHRKAAAPT
jgi:hypothetical protein